MSFDTLANQVVGRLTEHTYSYLPIISILSYIAIPAIRNAPLLKPTTKAGRWPVMVFSHGLGGSRNAYSHLVGSLASHGMVVIAPEHRDGSGPISYIRNSDGSFGKTIDYRPISHAQTADVEAGRDEQLKIRLWELDQVHEALLKIDRGERITNLGANKTHPGDVTEFVSSLDVHNPGAIAWAGHSFGAATVVQFVKSVFYRDRRSAPRSYTPLFTPSERADTSSIINQITPASPISLLDLWCLPLRSASTRWLWQKPLPSYSPEGSGGSSILAVLSDAFYKWRGNLVQLKHAVSENPSAEVPSSSASSSPPFILYPISSAHLSQSDFGVLFPWVTKKVFGTGEPQRTLRLNVRAILEMLRINKFDVADTSSLDMEESATSPDHERKFNGHASPRMNGSAKQSQRLIGQDRKILADDGSIRGWIFVKLDETKAHEAINEETDETAHPSAAIMDGEVMRQ